MSRRTVTALAATAALVALAGTAAVPATAAGPGDGDTAPQPALTDLTSPAYLANAALAYAHYAPAADRGRAKPAPAKPAPAKQDRLKVTVSGSGNRALNGSSTLTCNPVGGTHSQARAACAAIESAAADRAAEGADLFAPVSKDANCAMIYGGPATARVTGTWRGQSVDAEYSRANGCEISRWDQLVPALPDLAKKK